MPVLCALQELLDMLTTSGSLHQFPIYASLLRHASDHDLSLPDAAVVLSLAAEKGASLNECYSLSALSLALTEMPKVWAEQTGRAPKAVVMQVGKLTSNCDVTNQHHNRSEIHSIPCSSRISVSCVCLSCKCGAARKSMAYVMSVSMCLLAG